MERPSPSTTSGGREKRPPPTVEEALRGETASKDLRILLDHNHSGTKHSEGLGGNRDWAPENNGSSVMPPEMTAMVKLAEIVDSQFKILQNQATQLQIMESRFQMLQNWATQLEKEASGVKAHYLALRKVGMQNFYGCQEPEEAERWLNELEATFKVMEVPEDVKPVVVIPFLGGDALIWWNATSSAYTEGGQVLTWAVFRKIFLDHHFPEELRWEKDRQFFDLKQTENMSVMEYAREFYSLGYYVPEVMADEKLKLSRFRQGLNDIIKGTLFAATFEDFNDLYNRSIRVEALMRRVDEERAHKKRQKLE